MTIEILPARLANQIAAGEVVERPASVVKELVENSIDAGATTIKIDIEKGGAKRIRISDNGSGIAKEELTLALSRHATSKIKSLTDLEGICSLGFRGEALASISSVARLTLTSKPVEQDAAWQANAEGRDMAVSLQPAAHPDGTTIDVVDLFFNTPARRKFLRTEKTEFTHIEEVIKRIALAHFDVTFILSHNQKVIKQFKAVKDKSQYSKRVSQICGQKFIEHALEIDCQHDGLHLSGWIAEPSFARNQNDLCYSYVNGRMMRDKLINHAIRQSYSDMLPANTFPAFVLFLTLDYREVDVNVHPAKHEVRFHQGRYVHDFIYSVCHQALSDRQHGELFSHAESTTEFTSDLAQTQNVETLSGYQADSSNTGSSIKPVDYRKSRQSISTERDYIAPLRRVQDVPPQSFSAPSYSASSSNDLSYAGINNRTSPVETKAAEAYHQLMSPLAEGKAQEVIINTDICIAQGLVLKIVDEKYALINLENELRLLALTHLEHSIKLVEIKSRWQNGFVSQPLLLPIKLTLTDEQFVLLESHLAILEKLGIVISVLAKNAIQVRKFSAILREKDIAHSFFSLLDDLLISSKNNMKLLSNEHWQRAFSSLLVANCYTNEAVQELLEQSRVLFNSTLDQQLRLNSVSVDLTSAITKLT
jgi:DNA mismatch repair protein MutL